MFHAEIGNCVLPSRAWTDEQQQWSLNHTLPSQYTGCEDKGIKPPPCSTMELENKHGTCKFVFCASNNASINYQQIQWPQAKRQQYNPQVLNYNCILSINVDSQDSSITITTLASPWSGCLKNELDRLMIRTFLCKSSGFWSLNLTKWKTCNVEIYIYIWIKWVIHGSN